MPIRVGVIGESHLEAVLETHQSCHRVRAGAVHANFAVVIHRHEGERRVHLGIDHGDVKIVLLRNRLPVVDSGAAKRIGPQLEAGVANGLQVDDAAQIVDVGQDKIFLGGGVGIKGGAVGQAFDSDVAPRSSVLARS